MRGEFPTYSANAMPTQTCRAADCGSVRSLANAARNSCQRENLAHSCAAAETASPQISLVEALPLRRYDGNSGLKSWWKTVSTRENMFHTRECLPTCYDKTSRLPRTQTRTIKVGSPGLITSLETSTTS